MKTKRISDYGINIGSLAKGKLNKITDVPGVKVGHATIDTSTNKTGVTVIIPSEDNIFLNKLVAATYVINGYGKTSGLIQINELGQLESPIALTNTLNVGKVQDALIQYMIDETKKENVDIKSINTVIGECNDSYLNNISDRVVNSEQVFKAIENSTFDFLEGDVGAGKGMSCHKLKGGIGSSSRVFTLDNVSYTLGILVLTNHGKLEDLVIDGRKIGRDILTEVSTEAEADKGSCMIILATDLPLSSRQIKRLCSRVSMGLARVGSYTGHGSGEIVIGFSTANVIKHQSGDMIDDNGGNSINTFKILNEDKIDIAFRAVIESTEEAVLNSLICSDEIIGYGGNARESLKSFMHLY